MFARLFGLPGQPFLSIIAEVSVGWFTIDPARGRQAEWVWRSNWSAAWSRKNFMPLRRSISIIPSDVRRSSSTERILGAILFPLAALLRPCCRRVRVGSGRWRGGRG
jgi:hypothetical protein